MKSVWIFLLVALSLLILLAVDQYLFCPVYTFEDAAPFSGDSIYNPYRTLSTGKWLKCNFHTHARCWRGVTNGKGSAAEVHIAYEKLHYDVHAISNYQSIDTTCSRKSSYISSYEHGYNPRKIHQLVIGATHVYWKDYLLPQTLSNRQYLIDQLNRSAGDGLIVINHPMVRNGYRVTDMKYLTHISCLEVLNPASNATALWDTSLSAGKPVFIVASDDCHNVFDTAKPGRFCTWLNVTDTNPKAILAALKTGSGYGMSIGRWTKQDPDGKSEVPLPTLQVFSVVNDSMYARFSRPAKKIVVSGQYGGPLKVVRDTAIVAFKLAKSEAYARISARFADDTKILLNPVFRYRKNPLKQTAAYVSAAPTLYRKGIGILVIAYWLILILFLLNKSALVKKIV